MMELLLPCPLPKSSAARHMTMCIPCAFLQLQEQEETARQKLRRSQTEKPRVPTPMPSTPLQHKGVVHSPSAKPSMQSPETEVSPPAVPQGQLQQPASSVHWVPMQSGPPSAQPSLQLKAILQHESGQQQLAQGPMQAAHETRSGPPSAQPSPELKALLQHDSDKQQLAGGQTEAQSGAPSGQPSLQFRALPQRDSHKQQLTLDQIQAEQYTQSAPPPTPDVLPQSGHQEDDEAESRLLVQAARGQLQSPSTEPQPQPQADQLQNRAVSQRAQPGSAAREQSQPSQEQDDALPQLDKLQLPGLVQHQSQPAGEQKHALRRTQADQLRAPAEKQSLQLGQTANNDELQRKPPDQETPLVSETPSQPDQQQPLDQQNVLEREQQPKRHAQGMNQEQQPESQGQPDNKQQPSQGQSEQPSQRQSEQPALPCPGRQSQCERQIEPKHEGTCDQSKPECTSEQIPAQHQPTQPARRPPGSAKRRGRRKVSKQQHAQSQSDQTQPSLVPYGPAKQYVHSSCHAKLPQQQLHHLVSPSDQHSGLRTGPAVDAAPPDFKFQSALHAEQDNAQEEDWQKCILYPHILPASPQSNSPPAAPVLGTNIVKQAQQLAVQRMNDNKLRCIADDQPESPVSQKASVASAEAGGSGMGIKVTCLSSPVSPLNLETCPPSSDGASEVVFDGTATASLQQLRASGRLMHDKLVSYRLLDDVEESNSDA